MSAKINLLSVIHVARKCHFPQGISSAQKKKGKKINNQKFYDVLKKVQYSTHLHMHHFLTQGVFSTGPLAILWHVNKSLISFGTICDECYAIYLTDNTDSKHII